MRDLDPSVEMKMDRLRDELRMRMRMKSRCASEVLTTRLTTRRSQHSQVATALSRYGDGVGVACEVLIPAKLDFLPSHLAAGIATHVAHEQAECVLRGC